MKLLIELDEQYVKAIDKIKFLVGGRTDRKLQLEIMKAIKNGKALEQEPKTGRWIMTSDYLTTAYGCIDYVKCSCCGEDSLEEGDYCPNCGADMREVEE